MRLCALIALVVAMAACRVPDRFLPGSYKTSEGDSLVLTEDHFFRVETENPDTNIRLFRFSSGRWYRKRSRLYLTMDSKSMGEYWSCAPFRIRLHTLKRRDTCGHSKDMVFNKVIIKRNSAKKDLKTMKKEQRDMMREEKHPKKKKPDDKEDEKR
jgi:hypothetical protein